MKISIKPLSVNGAWKGRRFKSDEYKQYERDILMILPRFEVPVGRLSLYLEFGFSSRGADFDNPIKPFTDCLQKKYGFNDNKVFEAHIKKVIVKKGEEYIKFEIKELENV